MYPSGISKELSLLYNGELFAKFIETFESIGKIILSECFFRYSVAKGICASSSNEEPIAKPWAA